MTTNSVRSRRRQQSGPTDRQATPQVWVHCALLLTLVAIVFGTIVSYGFLTYDDDINVYKNPLLIGATAPDFVRIWSEDYERLYIPLTYSFFAVEVAISSLFGDDENMANPRVFRLGSLALHSACALLVLALLWQLTQNRIAAAIGAALFAVHPLQVESVAWITETKGLLSNFWGLLALWAYCRFVSVRTGVSPSSKTEEPAIKLSPWLAYILATACYALALLAKPSAVSIAIVAAILDYGWYRRHVVAVTLAVIPWLLLALVTWSVTAAAQSMHVEETFGLGTRVLIAGHSLAWYLQKLVLPCNLSPVYGCDLTELVNSSWLLWSWTIPTIVVITLYILPDRRVWLVALAIFGAALLPVLGFVPFDFQRISTVADRYAYLAMLGPAIVCAYSISRFSHRALVISAAILVAVLATLSYHQTKYWQDGQALFTRAALIAPRSAFVQNNLGTLAFRNERFAEAERYYTRAVDLDPEYALAHNNLGSVKATRGAVVEAISEFQLALTLDPNYLDAELYLARALLKTGDFDGASTVYETILKRHPDASHAYKEFGIALLAEGRNPEAEQLYRQAIHRFPEWPHAHANLAVALASQGELREAESAALEALRLDPQMADAQRNLALIRDRLASQTSTDSERGRSADPSRTDGILPEP